MLRADENTRRRMIVLFAVLGLFLGGTMLGGIAQRLGLTQKEEPPLSLAEIKAQHERIVQEARERRAFAQEMTALGQKERWEEAASTATKRLDRRHGDPFLLALRGEARFWAGQRSEAAHDFADVLQTGDPVSQADLLVLQGDTNGYRRVCEQTLAKTEVDTASALDSNNAAWVTSLGPDGLADYAPAVRLAEKGVAGARPEEKATYLNTLGGVLYRAGRDAEAIKVLEQTERLESEPFNWAFLALAHSRLGHAGDAKKWRDRLHQRLLETFATNQQQQSRHELLFLWAEVAQTVLTSHAK